jgi:AmmeMemoRadiSam system protein A
VPSPSAEPALDAGDVDRLFAIADAAILDGLRGGTRRLPAVEGLPDALLRPVNAFVTLTVDGALNGCIGGIEGTQPLAVAVAHYAWSAAFTDPRLPPLRAEEREHLVIEISLLSPLEPVPAATRAETLSQLRPHVDGLVIGCGARRGLFLPAVWEQLPDPDDFLDHLLLKAGLAPRSWPAGTVVSRFTARRYARKAGDRSSSAA